MLLILLKSAACLAIFMVFYKLFLERENMHQFKRYYLLAALIVSFVIPFVTFIKYVEPTFDISYFNVDHSAPINLIPIDEPVTEAPVNYLPIILWSVYGIGVLLFSTKFGFNLFRIISRINTNEKQKQGSFITVLLKDLVSPHTFFSYIFLNKKKYETKAIPQEVLLHEAAHAKQKHSLDVLFIELLQVVFWFNPLLYFIKKDIKLNHEFLADEAVLKHGIDSSTYQNTLLAFSNNAAEPELANAINYSLIKKRFTIMKTQTSKKAVWLRSLLLLPLLGGLLFSFSTTQEVEKEIVPKMKISNSENQNLDNSVYLVQPKKVSKEQFEGWKNETLFALWLDGKHIKNSKLNTMSNNDIVYFNSLMVKPEAKNEKFPQAYYTHLYTKEGFEKTYRESSGERDAKFEKIVSDILNKNERTLKQALESSINKVSYGVNTTHNEEPILTVNGIACVGCQLNLTKKGVEGLILATDTDEEILTFKIKIQGSSSVNHKGNVLNKESLSYVKAASVGTIIQLFDIKTVNKVKLPPVIITLVDKYDTTLSKSPIVRKGEKSSIPPPPAPDIKVKKGEASNIPPPPPPPPPPAPIEEYNKMRAAAKPNLPPPPPPKSPEDHVKEMASKGANFFYNGNEINADKAVEIVENNSKVNISTMVNNGKSTVNLSTKPITVVNGRATISEDRKQLSEDRRKALVSSKEAREKMLLKRKKSLENMKEARKNMQVQRKAQLEKRKEMMKVHRNENRRPLADQFKGMEAQGGEFFYEGDKISEEKAISLIKENPKLNVSMQNLNGKSTVHLSKKGIKVVNGKLVKKED